MTLYEVTSPYYSYGGYGFEPPEFGFDWILVDAETKRAAVMKAVKYFSTRLHNYMKDGCGDCSYSYGGSTTHPPFKHYKVLKWEMDPLFEEEDGLWTI